MTDPLSISAIATGLIVATGLICILKGTDPVVLLARWMYAGRRAVWILGTMLWDSAGEFRHRWVNQRTKDVRALADLEKQYPASEEREAAR